MSEISVITLSKYIRPAIIEVRSKNWVLNGKNNSFYEYIIDRYNGSPTNSRIINTNNLYTYGKGLDGNRNNYENWIKFKSVLSPKDVRKIVFDFNLYGQASMQIIKTKKGGLSSIKHLPKGNIAPSIVNEDNEIENYFVSENWKNTYKYPPKQFSAFGTSKDAIEIYDIKPYSAGKIYFSDPQYISGIVYAEVEEEIGNLYMNALKNGLSVGYIVNVQDGINWDAEEKENFKKEIKRNLIGSSNAGDYVVSFNGLNVSVTVVSLPVNDKLHKQWEFLTQEAQQKLITAHGASPSIAGIITSSGFSNTADEMEVARDHYLIQNIQPRQDILIEAFEEILVSYGININLFFKPLVEETTTVALSNLEYKATSEMANGLINLGSEMDSDKWILLSSADVDYDTDDEIYDTIKLASTGTARPNSKSEQDSEDIAIRYRYSGNKKGERDFCNLMLSANKLYRKEDIIQMGSKSVNEGFGKGGTNSYSIWLYKGGGKLSEAFPNGTCKHLWRREIYLKRDGGVDVNSPLAKTISTSEAKRRGFKVPTNPSDVSIAPNKNKS